MVLSDNYVHSYNNILSMRIWRTLCVPQFLLIGELQIIPPTANIPKLPFIKVIVCERHYSNRGKELETIYITY